MQLKRSTQLQAIKMLSRYGNLCIISIVSLICVEIVLVIFIFGSWPVVRLSNEADHHGSVRSFSSNISYIELGPGAGKGTIQKVVAQRNELSRQLNMLKQKLGQAECERLKSTSQAAVTSSGGWCETESKENGGKHLTDKPLAMALADLLKGKRVASFGDGPGRYKSIIDETKLLVLYDAYDGAPYCDITSEGRVKYLDLTLPQYGLPVYDYVISLEVAEHIPLAYEHIFVDNIVRHAREGIVLSWAKIGQPGFKHVNNKAFDDVKSMMKKLHFEHDMLSSKRLQEAATLPWLQTNTNAFKRLQNSNFSNSFLWS